jgi:N-methylhydantoinase B/oxoprolinase/acetone carboxylase alpha subunit
VAANKVISQAPVTVGRAIARIAADGLVIVLDRAPARVAEDVRNGFVSRDAALRDYGVEVREDGTAVRAD